MPLARLVPQAPVEWPHQRAPETAVLSRGRRGSRPLGASGAEWRPNRGCGRLLQDSIEGTVATQVVYAGSSGTGSSQVSMGWVPLTNPWGSFRSHR